MHSDNDGEEVAEAIKALEEYEKNVEALCANHTETCTPMDDLCEAIVEGLEVSEPTDEHKIKKCRVPRKLRIPMGLSKQKQKMNETLFECIQETYKVILMRYIKLQGAEFCQKRCLLDNMHNDDCMEINVFKFVIFHIAFANDNMLKERREQFKNNMMMEMKKSEKFISLEIHDKLIQSVLDKVYAGMTHEKGASYNKKDASIFLLNVLLRMVATLIAEA